MVISTKSKSTINVDAQLTADILYLIQNKCNAQLVIILSQVYPVDIAQIVKALPRPEAFELFNLLDYNTFINVVIELLI